VTVLTGAEPSLLGGGELALEIDVVVNDALSEIFSLAGVSGRLADVGLGRREACRLVAAEGRMLGEASGISSLESRIVRGCLGRATDACEAPVTGVGGSDRSRALEVSHPVSVGSAFDASFAAAMSSLPGRCFLSATLATVLRKTSVSRSEASGGVAGFDACKSSDA